MVKPIANGLAALFVLALGAVLALPAAAAPTGQCALDITPSSSTWSINGYNPFSTSPLSSTYTVLFHNSSDVTCDFDVVVRTSDEVYGLAGLGGQELPYTLLDASNNLNVTPFTGVTPSVQRAHLHLGAGGQQILRYAFLVDLTQLPTDGDFEQRLLISAEEGDGHVLNDRQIELDLDVAPSAVISLRGAFDAGPGGASVDLGKLATGPATTLLQLFVQSTGGYRLEAESANNGQLRLGGEPKWAIDYTLVVGGHAMNLTSAATLEAPRLNTARQDLLPIGFVIGDTSQKRAGRYEDVITLSVTAE
jgi:hypothetical protein